MTRKGMDPMKNEALFQWNELEPLCVLRLIVRKLWLAVLAALTAMMLASMILTNFVTTSYTCSVTFAFAAAVTPDESSEEMSVSSVLE